ncbi:MAG: hypothetical protein ACRCTQ_02200 [Brevinemataceae bacterium]
MLFDYAKKFQCINCGTVLDSLEQLSSKCQNHPNGSLFGSHQLINSFIPHDDQDILNNFLNSLKE